MHPTLLVNYLYRIILWLCLKLHAYRKPCYLQQSDGPDLFCVDCPDLTG
jgi:hypothetical protein